MSAAPPSPRASPGNPTLTVRMPPLYSCGCEKMVRARLRSAPIARSLTKVFLLCQQIGLTPYGDRLRRQRKLMLQALGANRIHAYHPLLEIQTHNLLQGILNAPEDTVNLVRRYSGGMTLLIVYGYRVLSNTDWLLEMAEEGLEILSNRIAAAGIVWMVDLIPARGWFSIVWPIGAARSRLIG